MASTVIAGSLKGKKLVNPEKGTRPLTNRIKQSLFDLINDFITPDASILDLYAGGGNFGIEALSRGVKEATFVDIAIDAVRSIEENLSTYKDDNYKIEHTNVQDYVRNTHDLFDVIMTDPPFDNIIVTHIKDATHVLKKNGVFIYRHPKNIKAPENLGELTKTYEQKYGKSVVSFYQNS